MHSDFSINSAYTLLGSNYESCPESSIVSLSYEYFYAVPGITVLSTKLSDVC